MSSNTQLTILDFQELPAVKNIEQEAVILKQNKELKEIVDFLETQRIEETKPILEAKKNIDKRWKDRQLPFIERINKNKSLLSDWLDFQESIKAKELKSDFGAKEGKELAKIETKVNSQISYRTDYEIEVVDIKKIPSKYLLMSVNEKLVKEMFKSNGKQLPGLKIKEIKTIINK